MADTATETETKERVELAPRWRVIVHNDDVTPAHFVVLILAAVFDRRIEDAERIMLEAHRTGAAHVVTLALEEAETRVEKAHVFSRVMSYPLTFTCEPDV